MRSEREATAEAVSNLAVAGKPVPDHIKNDVMSLWRYVQSAIELFVEEEDRVIDTLVVQATLRLMLDEHARIYKRLAEAGLAPRN